MGGINLMAIRFDDTDFDENDFIEETGELSNIHIAEVEDEEIDFEKEYEESLMAYFGVDEFESIEDQMIQIENAG